MEIEATFNEKVFGIICEDIEYFFEKAKEDIRQQGEGLGRHPRGQVLVALGLMAYTEFVGNYVPESERRRKGNQGVFDAFFRRLEKGYEEFLESEKANNRNVYNIFRNGLVHRCFIKEDCTIAISNNDRTFLVKGEPEVEIQRPVDVGIGLAKNGSYYLVLEKYYEDFKNACEVLLDEIKNKSPFKAPENYTGQYDSTGTGTYYDTNMSE